MGQRSFAGKKSNIFNDPLKSAKQHFSMDHCIQDSLSSFIEIYQTRLLTDLYLFHPQRKAEDGKTWLVEYLEREELHSTTDRPLEVPLKSDSNELQNKIPVILSETVHTLDLICDPALVESTFKSSHSIRISCARMV
jgi:hypothetical protein